MIEYKFYKEKLEDYFFNLVLNQNIAYFNKHKVGPYEYNGRFAYEVDHRSSKFLEHVKHQNIEGCDGKWKYAI